MLFSFTAHSSIDHIAILSLGPDGEEQVKVVKTKILQHKMIKLLSIINNSVQTKLSTQRKMKNGWRISVIGVGIGAFGVGQVGPWLLAAAAKQRMFFTR